MARITMKTAPTNTVEELFPTFLSAAAARGVKDKTLNTYKQHFRAISKRLDVTVPINRLNKSDLDNMILKMLFFFCFLLLLKIFQNGMHSDDSVSHVSVLMKRTF